MAEMKFRKCRRCEVVKEITEFYTHSGRSDGYQTWCKSCKAEYAKNTKPSEYSNEPVEEVVSGDCKGVLMDNGDLLFYINNHTITEEQVQILIAMLEYLKSAS